MVGDINTAVQSTSDPVRMNVTMMKRILQLK